MADIKLLDCTLRDGGYLNDWNFGKHCISDIITSLEKSHIDIIECGFLTNTKSSENKSIFGKANDINNLISGLSKYALMINFGNINADSIEYNNIYDLEIRIAFKKHNLNDIESFCKKLDRKKIKYSLNPMHTSLYSESELEKLISITNKLNPTCLTVVDTMGIMTESDTEELFKILNKNLSESIPLGFHSHNNLDLSINNINKLLHLKFKKDIIIDSSLSGIGRGGGMPETELLSELLNHSYNKDYSTSVLKYFANLYTETLSISDKKYKYMYKLSAKNKCHPNYAKFLIDNKINDIYMTNKLLSQIPTEYKALYKPEIIENIIQNSLTNVTV